MGKLELSELFNEIGKDAVSGCSFLNSIYPSASTTCDSGCGKGLFRQYDDCRSEQVR
jgi:hypothetical protein